MSGSGFTPESLFRVSTLAWTPDPGDWAVRGAHLRAWVAPAVGFPLHPFLLWPVRRTAVDDATVTVELLWWIDTDDGPRTVDRGSQIDVGGNGGVVYGDLVGPGLEIDPWFCWVRVDVEGSSALQLDVVGRGPADTRRTLLRRSAEPYALGASRITRIRLTGDGTVTAVRGVDAARFRPDDLEDEPLRLGLPLGGDSRWYRDTGADGVQAAVDAAPRRSGPPDSPAGPVPLTQDDERSRITALTRDLGDTSLAPLLDAAYGESPLPRRHRTVLPPLPGPGAEQTSEIAFDTVETLLTAAADPGVARWLGLLGQDPRVDPGPDSGEPYAWIATGIWAVDPDAVVSRGPDTTVSGVLAGAAAGEIDEAALEAWRAKVSEVYGDFPPSGEDLGGVFSDSGLLVQPLVVPAALGAAPDRPDTPQPVLDGPGSWQGGETYTRGLRMRPSPAGPVAFARTTAGETVSLHNRVPTPAGPTLVERATTLLPGRAGGDAVLTDDDVPAGGPSTWQVATADEFGRWSPAGTVSGDPPARPPLPRPVVEAVFLPAVADGLPETGPAVPGTVAVQFAIPGPDALAPGSRPVQLVRVTTTTSHERIEVAADTPGLVVREFPAPSTAVGDGGTDTIEVAYSADAGAGSVTIVTVPVRDPRRPPPLDVGPAVLWTSRPDPTGRAEIALRLPVPRPGWTYRVYVGEERALAGALGIAPPVPAGVSRAERARRIVEGGAQLTARRMFTLAPASSLVPDGDGVLFTFAVPGSVRTLRLVRVVPVTPAGVEAAFPRCGLVPVAVPGDDRPPAPALTARPGGTGVTVGVTVGVTAYGLDTALMARLQPGGAAPPQYRLRRTSRPTADPLYATGTDLADLEPVPGSPGVFRAEVEVRGLAPYVRHTWSAEVRYPPEVALAAAMPLGGVVTPDHAVAGEPRSSPWSPASAPVTAMVTSPIPAVHATVVRTGHGGTAVVLAGAPVADGDAVGPWRVRVWRRSAEGHLTPVEPGVPAADGWVVTGSDLRIVDAAAEPAGYVLVLVDPLGRTGPPTDAPLPPLVPTTTTVLPLDSWTTSGIVGADLFITVGGPAPAGTQPPGGTVHVRIGGGADFGQVPLQDDQALLHLDFAEFGDGTVTVSYSGDERYAASQTGPVRLPPPPPNPEEPRR